MRQLLIAAVGDDLAQRGSFPDKAKAMELELRSRHKRGDYDQISSAQDFASTLTADLQRVSHDRHIDVGYSEAVIPIAPPGADPDAMTPDQQQEMVRRNYGFESVQRLNFNIGYIDLRMFAPADQVIDRLGAAMTLVSDTDDLIIDLRANNGGDPKTVVLLASYLFDGRTRLNDIYDRPTNRTEQGWTHDHLAGPSYGGKRKVYLLTSRDTFSAGEDFAYALKNLKRATLVGESTGGGAHPGSAVRLNDHFGAIVPSARSISPITNTDWEGVGVIPDVATDADDALVRAETMILQSRLRAEKNPARRERLEHRLSEID
jgi:C-terminal processing protease CtpA/Prc